MSTSNTPNESPFDMVAFEAAAKARVAEFVGQVARLALFRVEDESTEWLEVSGAQYALYDNSQVAARHEMWYSDPTKKVAKLKIVRPFVQSLGADRNLRRVQISRLILCRTFSDVPDPEQLALLQDELPPAPELEELGKTYMEQLRYARIADQLDPAWRPGELLLARTITHVECKLPNSPNFRTERYSPSMPAHTKMAHIAARRHAGEPVTDPPYDVAEHSALIALLSSIDTTLMEPQPLDPDFDETWLDPEPNLRSWWPKEW